MEIVEGTLAIVGLLTLLDFACRCAEDGIIETVSKMRIWRL